MEIMLNKVILAVVTTNAEKVAGASVPVFLCADEAEREKVAFSLGKITGAMVHDLENGVYIIVRH